MNLLGYKEPNLVHLARCKVTISTMHFFMYHGIFFPSMENTFYHPPWKILFLPPSKIFLSAMDKFSIWSRLVIWILDPRANVVRQEVQYCALRRRWKTLFLIWGWVLMMVMVMMMVLESFSQGCPEGSASTSLQCTGLGIQFCRCLLKGEILLDWEGASWKTARIGSWGARGVRVSVRPSGITCNCYTINITSSIIVCQCDHQV